MLKLTNLSNNTKVEKLGKIALEDAQKISGGAGAPGIATSAAGATVGYYGTRAAWDLGVATGRLASGDGFTLPEPGTDSVYEGGKEFAGVAGGAIGAASLSN